jgi:hypothetical protein
VGVGQALERLARHRALQTLVRGTLLPPVLKRLLGGGAPSRARDLPPEIWASLAVAAALEVPEVGSALAEALHDRLAWDAEPPGLADWERLADEQPLQALWMAAISPTKSVRKAFPELARRCLATFRASPACKPPSWDFVEGILDIQGATLREMRDREREAEQAARRFDAERERLEELREELRRLRRETGSLRAEKAQAERRAEALETHAGSESVASKDARLEALERRLRKSEKEREHLLREIERMSPTPASRASGDSEARADVGPRPAVRQQPPGSAAPPVAQDPNPRRRVLRQMLRKLYKKGKIGASHTHEDNVYRGIPDHEKGFAKEAMALLYREGYLLPKPTATDPHVSLSPELTGDVRAIIAGEIANPRLRRFVEDASGPRGPGGPA